MPEARSTDSNTPLGRRTASVPSLPWAWEPSSPDAGSRSVQLTAPVEAVSAVSRALVLTCPVSTTTRPSDCHRP